VSLELNTSKDVFPRLSADIAAQLKATHGITVEERRATPGPRKLGLPGEVFGFVVRHSAEILITLRIALEIWKAAWNRQRPTTSPEPKHSRKRKKTPRHSGPEPTKNSIPDFYATITVDDQVLRLPATPDVIAAFIELLEKRYAKRRHA